MGVDSLHHVGVSYQTQALRFRGSGFYLLSHLAGSTYFTVYNIFQFYPCDDQILFFL